MRRIAFNVALIIAAAASLYLMAPREPAAQLGGGVVQGGAVAANDCVKWLSANVIGSAGDVCGLGAGDVVGPVSATDGAITLFDGTTGNLLKDSKVVLTIPASAATLTLGSGKTVAISNTLTFTGTDSSTVALGAGGTVAYQANNLSVFAATTSAQLAGVISNETGTGLLPFATNPTFVGPLLTVVAVGSLPTCNGAAEGMLYGVNDALTPTFGAVLVGGGAVHTMAYCNGTDWISP